MAFGKPWGSVKGVNAVHPLSDKECFVVLIFLLYRGDVNKMYVMLCSCVFVSFYTVILCSIYCRC